MAWTSKIFRSRDILVLLIGVSIVQALAFLLIDRFMFHPVKNGYGKDIDGFIDIGTNAVPIAARIVGACKGKKTIMYSCCRRLYCRDIRLSGVWSFRWNAGRRGMLQKCIQAL